MLKILNNFIERESTVSFQITIVGFMEYYTKFNKTEKTLNN